MESDHSMTPACGSMRQDREAATTALRVYGNLTTIELAPVLLALETRGSADTVLAQGGILSLYGEGAQDLPNLRAGGRSHLATNSETQGLRYSVAHADLRFVFTIALGLYRLVGRRSAGINDLADLRGKRIGTMPGTSSAYYLCRLLQQAGLAESDVVIVPYVAGGDRPLSGMSAALIRGELDAVTIWEPEMQRCVDALGADAVEFLGADGYREQFSLYSTAALLADPLWRPRIVDFVRALIDASARLRQAPRIGWPLVAHAARIDAVDVERSWPHHHFPGTLQTDLLDLLVAQEPWVAALAGRSPRQRSELATLIDPSILQEALLT